MTTPYRKKYFHHDDRGDNRFVRRQVSFKHIGHRRTQKDWNPSVRRLLDEGEDIDMVNNATKKEGTAPNRMNWLQRPRRGLKSGYSKFNDRKLSESSSSWYKVTILHGKKYNRQEIIKTLQSFIQPIPLLPIYIQLEDDDMTFFIDNYKVAQRINDANLKLQMRDGWKIQVKVEPRMPYVEPNAELTQKIKEVMSSKYDAMTCGLDLSRFHANQVFLDNDLFVPLNRQVMLLCVFQIIAESVPNIQALNLSENKIFTTEHFSMLKRHACNLKSLDLSKNKIKDFSELNCLQGLELENLVLDNNPLCDKYHDQTSYVREARKIFKRLLRLDGVELPPPVNFDIEESLNKLPQSHGSFLCNVEGRDFTKTFLEQFFQMYDSETDRKAIAEAYAENAQFSMNIFNSSGGLINKFLTESRNLKRVPNYERRTKLLHVGRPEIVRFLNTLPKTQHDLPSFTVDLLVFTPNLISLVVSGVFREPESMEVKSPSHIKAFSRIFAIVPTANGGFNIVNDMLSITNASTQQIEVAFQAQPSTSIQTPSSTSLNVTPVSPVAPVNVAPPNSPQEAELDQKRQMVTMLAMQTGMNLLWSEKCLVETNWDFNKALYAFTEFNKLGQIPPEAFNK